MTGSAAEVFSAFLKLGLTSFGGPIAHLGYFHRELIERRRWVDESRYAQLVAVCQFLPGPASSQLGFALGLIRAGWVGGLAAFVAFTLPSALLLFAFAHVIPFLERPFGQAAVHGLKLVAVAVVAQGVWTMAKRLTPDVPRALIAVTAGSVVLLRSSATAQLGVIAGGALLGVLMCRRLSPIAVEEFALRYGSRTGLFLLAIFAVVLAAAITTEHLSIPLAAVAAAFYRAGGLVFGGGHVVLPLLREAVVVPGWVSNDEFLAGYGAAQAVPGPIFSIAAFLGARINGLFGAATALLAIFLPGFLLVAGVLPLWKRLSSSVRSLRALAGVNAAVVGLLAAALYDPLWKTAVMAPADIAIALVSFVLLIAMRASALSVLAWCVAASMARTAFAI